MGPLRNPKHEKYCQLLFEGQPQNAAYEAAGYRFHEGNASRLRSNEQVIARLTELQSEAAKSSEITVASLVAELEDARRRGLELNMIGAAVRAIEAKGKLSGLFEQKIRVTH
jgi:hypothetical protein